MRRWLSVWSLSVVALVAALVLAAACTGQQEATKPQAKAAGPEVTALAVGTTADPQVGGPWIIAREKGFFAQEGLTQAEVKVFPSGPATFPAFVSGDLKGNTHAEQPMITQAAGGVKLKLVGVYADITGVHGMVGSARVKTAKDLEGKKVALQKASTMDWYTKNFCKTFACDISKVEVVNMPPAEGVTALVNGNVDGFAIWQPFFSRALQAGKDKGLHPLHYNNTSFLVGAEGPRKIHTAYSILYVAPEFLEKNPRTVDAILRALDKAVTFINNNQAETVKIFAKEYKQPEDEMDGIVRAIRYGLALNEERVKDIEGMVDLLLTEKLIKEKVEIRKDILDTAPLKRVKPEAVTVGG
ncbi:MAG: ABC transporter substrate-binding protein [Chloroflexi bacterium]|nr:ABC transporter substrate-binding protein [Chloroflexota bacterium]MBI4507384.1 ABC transporter substrate-binding protein [Chloroflexota bacterium]